MLENNFIRFTLLLNCILVSIAECNEPPQVLSQRSVGNNDSFSMWCNITSFRDVELPPNGTSFRYIGLFRKTGDQSMQQFAMYEPEAKSRPTLFIVPPGRAWEFSYDGGDYEFNKQTISLNLTVLDGDCSDAGVYRCGVYINGYHKQFYSTPAYLMPRSPMYEGDERGCIGRSVALPIIDKSVIAPNDEFTVTCDISKFHDVHLPPAGDFESISIMRQLMNGNRQRIVTHSPWDRQYKDEAMLIPYGRNWTVFAGGQLADMTISLNVTDARCEDAGTYLCMIKLLEQDIYIYSTPFELTAKGNSEIVLNQITVHPSHGVMNRTSNNVVGELITLECTYTGPENLTNRWASTRHASYLPDTVDYPARIEKDNKHCPTYFYNSSYRLILVKEDNAVSYICSVYKKNERWGETAIQFFIQELQKGGISYSKSGSFKVEADLSLLLCVMGGYVAVWC